MIDDSSNPPVSARSANAKRSPQSSNLPINQSSTENKKDRYIAGLLVLCLLLVGFWEVMSSRSERPWAAFQLGAADFEGFKFECKGWSVVKRDVSPSPIEPEILKYDLMPTSRQDHGLRATDYGYSVRARLIHGYNMVDCMRIKGYTVKLKFDGMTTDYGLRTTGFPGRQSLPDLPIYEASCSAAYNQICVDSGHLARGRAGGQLSPRSPSSSAFSASLRDAFPFGRVQVWELENSVGDKSIWVTSMLRAGDFAVLDVSTTDMAFPRVGVPDNPNWLPTGVGWKSFRHPIRNFKLMMRSKWNGARCDLMVFLKFKQPQWADEEVLTLVSNMERFEARGTKHEAREREEMRVRGVLVAHGLFYGELVKWKRSPAE